MKKKILLISLFLVSLSLPVVFASAQTLKDAFDTDTGNPLGDAGSQAGYEAISAENSVEVMVGKVIQTFLSILGIIFLILMIYAGYNWMTAHGDEQKVTKAKETITAAIIGLVIVIGAYALAFFVISKLTADTLQ